MRAALAIALLLAPLAGGCISFNYVRTSLGEPVRDAAVAALHPGEVDLEACLDALGAPELVWPSEDGRIHLAWAWTDVADWGLAVSWAFEQFVSAQLSLDSVDWQVESLVLAFDDELRLVHLSRGKLWDLVPSAQQSTAAGRMMRRTPR